MRPVDRVDAASFLMNILCFLCFKYATTPGPVTSAEFWENDRKSYIGLIVLVSSREAYRECE